MLELLSLRKGTTLTKEMFLKQLTGMDEPELRSSTCHPAGKKAASQGKNYIETVGRGCAARAARRRGEDSA
jgi:hypothetical protein